MQKNDFEKAIKGWEKLLNPELLKTNLMFVATYLAAYEMLKSDSLIERVRDFYTNGFDEKGDRVTPDYQSKVLTLDKSPMKASALWFQNMGALDQADMNLLDELRKYRNDIAHSLPKIILSPEGEFRADLFAAMLSLIKKIDIFWIRNFEMDLDEEFVGREIPDEEISSGNMMVLHLMTQVAFGDETKAKEFLASWRAGLEEKIKGAN